jgi:hypothetical protein
VFSTYGSHNLEIIKKAVGKTFWRKKETFKHRYFYVLTNKIERRNILKNLKHPCLPYPKEVVFKEEIEEIKVETVVENRFFN